jgi:mevalonate kinase
MKFYTPGKLLLSGEYVVLDGATALAVPTKDYGQSLEVGPSQTNEHYWQSFDPNGLWFEATFSLDLNQTISTNNSEVARTLQNILTRIKNFNSDLFKAPLSFKTKLDFNRNWGFGSSSTLIALLSKWSKMNAFQLLNKTFGGSGYDVAVAMINSSILYQLNASNDKMPNKIGSKAAFFERVNFKPSFSDQLFLVYLDRKQNSREAIKTYKQSKPKQADIDQINHITYALLRTKDLKTFETLLNQHEQILSKILQRPTIKQQLFADYSNTIKSLGAWGGDFILATGQEAPDYFTKKGLSIIIPFNTIV